MFATPVLIRGRNPRSGLDIDAEHGSGRTDLEDIELGSMAPADPEPSTKPDRSPRLAAPAARRYKRGGFPAAASKKAPMALERTFSILKPDVTRRNLTGAVNARIEAAGLRIVAQKRVRMTRAEAERFYGVHKERPFFAELVAMMTAAPVVVQVLEGEDAIRRYRDAMGATDPAKAAPGAIRKDFALSMGENSVHGSDAPETAAVEIAQFFSGNEIVG